MKCYICDATLSETGVHWDADHQDWAPCPSCQAVINEVFDDPLDEDEVTTALEQEWPILVPSDEPTNPPEEST
jgi:hypothetical protein